MRTILTHIFLAIIITYPAFSKDKSKIQPAELVDFYAIYNGNYVELKWSTSSESNTSKFILQKTEISYGDSTDYNSIAEVKASKNSNKKEVYYFSDKNIELGKRYNYRLMLEDLDGTIHNYNTLIASVFVEPNFNVEFSTKYITDKVEIDWTIKYPEKIEYYYIERVEVISANGQSKNKIVLDSIKAKKPSDTVENYKLYDSLLESNIEYRYSLLVKIEGISEKQRIAFDDIIIKSILSVENAIVRAFDISAPVNSDKIHFTLELEKASNVRLNIYNILGSKVKILNTGQLGGGKSEFYLNKSELSPGTYFYTIQLDNSISSGKFQVVR